MNSARQISISTLPLGGSVQNLYDFSFVEIRPLTFLDIVEYVRNRPSGSDRLVDYEFFMYNLSIIKNKISLWNQLLWPDLLYTSYLMWCLSINSDFSFSLSYTCSSCGHLNKLSVDITSVRFKPYGGPGFIIELDKENKLKGWFRRAAEIEKKINEYLQRARFNPMPLDVAILMFSLELYDKNPLEAERLIKNATHDLAYQLLDYLYYITHPLLPIEHQCNNSECMKITQVPFYYSVERDFFLVFLENRGYTPVSPELGGNNEIAEPFELNVTRNDSHV